MMFANCVRCGVELKFNLVSFPFVADLSSSVCMRARQLTTVCGNEINRKQAFNRREAGAQKQSKKFFIT